MKPRDYKPEEIPLTDHDYRDWMSTFLCCEEDEETAGMLMQELTSRTNQIIILKRAIADLMVQYEIPASDYLKKLVQE